MNKNLLTSLLLILAACSGSNFIQAQSAVALCPTTNKYGLASGASSESEAKDAAIQKCKQDCNSYPKIIASTGSSGYGCIFSGMDENGKFYLAASLGNSSSYGAEEKARDALPFGIVEYKKEYEFYDKGGVARVAAPVETAPQVPANEIKANEYFQKQDFSNALIYAKLALDNRYTHEITMMYGYCLLVLERYQEAWDVFDKEIRVRYSSDPMAYHYRGDMAANLEKWDAAVQDYTTAINKGDQENVVYRSKGYAQINLGDNDGAIQSYNQYIQKVQSDFVAYYMRGLAYNAKEDYENAKSDFTKAIDLGCKIPKTFFLRGEIHFNQNNNADAISDFTKASELAPEDPTNWYFLGFALARGGKLQSAVEAYNTCIKLNPDIPDAWKYRGLIKWMLNDKENAEKDFNKAIELNPELKDEISKMKGS